MKFSDYLKESEQAFSEKKYNELYANFTDRMIGGVGDNKKPSDFDKSVLKNAVKHELEHTDDMNIAFEIAIDHLTEDENYYTKLEEIEND